MVRKKAMIEMTKPVKRVKLLKDAYSGGDIFNISNFTEGKEYEVRGVTQKRYSDGETVPCYLVLDDSKVLREVAIDKFEVID